MDDRPPTNVPPMQRMELPICIDPTQVGVIAPDQDGPETLDEYIRRVAREEARKATRTGKQAVGVPG